MNLDRLSPEDLRRGYETDPDTGVMRCLRCGRCFEPGEVYPEGERFFAAERAVRRHRDREHPDYAETLIHSDSKYNTLTENQRELLALFAAGTADKEIARRLGLSASTVRHQRFIFREKAKAARLYLAVYDLALGDKQRGESDIVPIHNHATMVDQRYVITEEERAHILATAFHSLDPLKLKSFSPKEKKKLVILARIAQGFETGRRYTEAEVNAVLKDIFDDFATLRRYLIEYGFMKRTRDGAAYWRTDACDDAGAGPEA